MAALAAQTSAIKVFFFFPPRATLFAISAERARALFTHVKGAKIYWQQGTRVIGRIRYLTLGAGHRVRVVVRVTTTTTKTCQVV